MYLRKACMMMVCLFTTYASFSQINDSSFFSDKNVVVLTPVVVGKGLNASAFISRVINDTSFYKAFKNLRVLNYTMLNDVRMQECRKVRIALDIYNVIIELNRNFDALYSTQHYMEIDLHIEMISINDSFSSIQNSFNNIQHKISLLLLTPNNSIITI